MNCFIFTTLLYAHLFTPMHYWMNLTVAIVFHQIRQNAVN